MKSNQLQWIMKSAVGDIYLVASEKGLQGILWKKHPAPLIKSLEGEGPQLNFLRQTQRELTEYFEGRRKVFTVPLDVSGTEFQTKVWRELSRIPYGKTTSYKGIAQRLETKGVRAVGTANGRNPISIIVPCHRVIASDGTLGGYAGGLDIKKRLLELEQNLFSSTVSPS